MARITACLAALLLFCTAAASAQERGVITGMVRLAGGAMPAGGVAVELVRGAVIATTVADSVGAFRFDNVSPGTYDVIARVVGYEAEAKGVRVAAGTASTLTLTLEVSAVALPSLQVATSVVQISRADTDFGSRISTEAIRTLPTSHDARDLVALTPGARTAHVWGGATAQANNYQLDGVAANHPGVGGDLIQPSINWIESVEVRGLGAGAEYGNFQGGLINVITKSGTPQLQGMLRLSGETHHLNASALEPDEIGSELARRYDIEGELRGPILRDRLVYYIAGQWLERDLRYIDHLPPRAERYAPTLEQRGEGKFFGKLTLRAGAQHTADVSLARMENRTDHYGLSGYETAEGTLRVSAPTTAFNASWTSRFAGDNVLEAKFAHLTRNERRDPYAPEDVPGVLTWGINPPYVAFQNAALRYVHDVASTGGSIALSMSRRISGLEQLLKLGVEHSAGAFVDQRIRNGGMTWRPPRMSSLDPADASTWFVSSMPLLASVWGGEVDLHAEVESSAAFVQSTIALNSRVSISPGIRYGRWRGSLLPGGHASERFLAVEDVAPEPRVGLIVDITGNGSLVAKAHWGRFHQNMIAQMFERVAGGNVFTDEETWYYRGPVFTNPHTTFTAAERAALAQSNQFTREKVITLNEAGPVENYRQPYVDQWIVGLEKSIRDVVKLQALYVNRRNRSMVALVDRNRATNYTRYELVRVFSGSEPLPFEGGRVQLREVYLPNWALRERLVCGARGLCPDAPMPPFLSFADTASLTWQPDYVLTTAPDARRKFDQLQLSVLVSRPRWTATASYVFTDLEGNLDNVTGYDDPSGFGAGPYVRVNEGVNSYGKLPNYADQEVKVMFFGELPWKLRGGAYWSRFSGDHFAPFFTISGDGTYTYRTNDQRNIIDSAFFYSLGGHRIFIGPRGLQQYHRRSQIDLKLEREIVVRDRALTLTVDLFNAFNSAVITEVNRSVNRGQNYYTHFGPQYEGIPPRIIDPTSFYRATRQREAPRSMRIGTIYRF